MCVYGKAYICLNILYTKFICTNKYVYVVLTYVRSVLFQYNEKEVIFGSIWQFIDSKLHTRASINKHK